MLKDEITDAQLAALRLAARSSQYHLLLGAGASFGTKSPDGRPLPSGPGLAEEIAKEFDVAFEDGDLLWRIYDRAVEKHAAGPIYHWLRKRFFNVTPPEWMQKYARFPWEKVWSLNIDDAFEASYRAVRTEASRDIQVASWDSDAVDSKRLPIIHLHGHVHESTPSGLVFSLAEYYKSTVSRATWPLIFRDQYGVNPFVIIGARLRDEPDIEAVLRRRPEHQAPSFYVNPDISPGMESDLRAWRLVPIRATAEDFLSKWAELTNMDLDEPPTRPEEYAMRVTRQFRELKVETPGKVPRLHDFLGGDEPRWTDIVAGVPAAMDWSEKGKGQVQNILGKNSSTCLIYVGDRLSGRSTGLLDVALAFRRANWRVFQFTADELPDRDAILQYASDGKALLLVFDGVADFAQEVAGIVGEARAAKMSVSCLAVDLRERNDSIVGRIPAALLAGGQIYEIPRTLSLTSASALVKRLQQAARLGQLEPLGEQPQGKSKQIAYFRGREIFAQMAGLEMAPGFGRRVGQAVKDLESSEEVEIAFLASLAFRLGRRISVLELGRMTGIRPEEVLRKIRGGSPLAALFSAEDHTVTSRHRWLALEPLINELGEGRALELLAESIRRLRPSISQQGNRERNAPDTLVGSMMSYKSLSSIFPEQSFEKWYGSLETTFGPWSARFWEQRAIANREAGSKDLAAASRAESFARRAVTITNDTYANTTLGTVLMARAAQIIGVDLRDGSKYYEEAYSTFQLARMLDQSNNVVALMAYLRYSLRVLESLSGQEGLECEVVRQKVESDWANTHLDLALLVSVSEDTKERLSGLQRRFQAVVEGEAAESTSDKPMIKGRPVVGMRLKGFSGEWPSGYSLSYQWKRNNEKIEGANALEYYVRSEDIGSRLALTVAGKKLGYGTKYTTSLPSPLVTSM